MLYPCADSNVKHGDEDFIGYCYSDDQCQTVLGYSTFRYGLNSCCGYVIFSGYYSLTNDGDCLSCKDYMIANSLYIIL